LKPAAVLLAKCVKTVIVWQDARQNIWIIINAQAIGDKGNIRMLIVA
jgi:hypothetical protein